MLDIQTIIKNTVNARADSMAQAKIAPRFRYPIDKDTAARMLAAAYRVEVEARHRTLMMDAGTRDKIAHAARWLTDATLPPSLLLYGSMPGTGKTTLALAIKGMAVALHESLLEGIGAAEQSLRMRAEKHFENFELSTPDAFRYYMATSAPSGRDGNYSDEDFKEKVNAHLANSMGNLLNRTLSMLVKYFDGEVKPEFKLSDHPELVSGSQTVAKKALNRLSKIILIILK